MASKTESATKQYMNYAPAGLNPKKDLPAGFFDFLLPLHKQFTPWQQKLAAKRAEVLQCRTADTAKLLVSLGSDSFQLAHRTTRLVRDQRNQMTGPATMRRSP